VQESPFRQTLVLSPEDLGQVIRNRRKALRLTQDDLALDMGITRQRLGDLERGKPGIHLDVALRACKALGLRVAVGGMP
jgi:y4mF family transcriptional regulator